MSASIRWTGLTELRAQLRRLPEDLTGEANHVVQGAANGAAVAARSAYADHRVTGNLQDHVEVLPGTHDRFGAAYVVRNPARHAQIFENGSEARHTAEGWNRGRMPPSHAFVRAMIRARGPMYRDLANMITRVTGWKVTGTLG